MDINKIIWDISSQQSYMIEEEIRNLCRTYWFEPENIKDTPYRLVIELKWHNIRDIYLTKIKDVRTVEIITNISIDK